MFFPRFRVKMMISQRVLKSQRRFLSEVVRRRCRPVSSFSSIFEATRIHLKKEVEAHLKVDPRLGWSSRQFATSYPNWFPSKGSGEGDENSVIRCWQCNKIIDSINDQNSADKLNSNNISTCQKCGSLQRIAGDVNFFSLFKIPEVYDIDLGTLRKQYLRLQEEMHPDRNVNRSNTEADFSTDNSSLINSAYRTLRDPYQRALYLLKHRYMIIIGEEDTTTGSHNLESVTPDEPDLLLEIMELNEEIELAAGDRDALRALNSQLEETLAGLVTGLRVAFDENDSGSEARRLALRFSYYLSALGKVKSSLLKV